MRITCLRLYYLIRWYCCKVWVCTFRITLRYIVLALQILFYRVDNWCSCLENAVSNCIDWNPTNLKRVLFLNKIEAYVYCLVPGFCVCKPSNLEDVLSKKHIAVRSMHKHHLHPLMAGYVELEEILHRCKFLAEYPSIIFAVTPLSTCSTT